MKTEIYKKNISSELKDLLVKRGFVKDVFIINNNGVKTLTSI